MFDEFPYTNFHELNLDWIIRVIKDFNTRYPEMIEEISKKISKPENDPNGEYGTFLMALGDGHTKWQNISVAYSDIIINAVNEWLDDHPEATTTVEDGAITPAKLNTDLLAAYNKSGNVLYMFPSYQLATYTQSFAVVKTPNKTIIMDTGYDSNWDLTYKPFLDDLFTKRIITNIDYIVISHYHFDHIGNLVNILNSYPHTNCKVFLPPNIENHYATRTDIVASYYNTIDYLEHNSIYYEVINEKTTRDLDNGFVYADFMNTDSASWSFYDSSETDYNNYSMVTIIKSGDTKAIFPGDILNLAQKRLTDLREITAVNILAYPHHALEDDDYLPFLDMLNPEHTIITTSPNRILTANNASIANYVNGDLYALAYDNVVCVADKAATSIIEGRTITRIGNAQTAATIYVDNSRSDYLYKDGSEDHPYKTVEEAILHISMHPGIWNRILINPTSISYGSVYLRDIDTPIEIESSVDASHMPIFDWMFIDNCDRVEVYWLKFKGAGKDETNRYHLKISRSSVYVSACEFDGENTSNLNGILVMHNFNTYVYNCTFRNFYPTSGLGNGIASYQYGSVVTRGNTFIDVDCAYRLTFMELTINASDTLTGTNTRWIVSSGTQGYPFKIVKQAITADGLAKIASSAISYPVYYNGDIAIIKGNKLFNVLTGAEITV